MGALIQQYRLFLVIWLIFVSSALALFYYLSIYQATNSAITNFKVNTIKINQYK